MDADPKTAEALTPEVLDAGAPGPDGAGGDDAAAVDEQVTRPDEADPDRLDGADDARRGATRPARRRRAVVACSEIHEKSLNELEGVLSPELQKELDEVVLPFTLRHAERFRAAPRAGAARRLARRACSTASRRRCSPSRRWRKVSSKRCGAGG